MSFPWGTETKVKAILSAAWFFFFEYTISVSFWSVHTHTHTHKNKGGKHLCVQFKSLYGTGKLLVSQSLFQLLDSTQHSKRRVDAGSTWEKKNLSAELGYANGSIKESRTECNSLIHRLTGLLCKLSSWTIASKCLFLLLKRLKVKKKKWLKSFKLLVTQIVQVFLVCLFFGLMLVPATQMDSWLLLNTACNIAYIQRSRTGKKNSFFLWHYTQSN